MHANSPYLIISLHLPTNTASPNLHSISHLHDTQSPTLAMSNSTIPPSDSFASDSRWSGSKAGCPHVRRIQYPHIPFIHALETRSGGSKRPGDSYVSPGVEGNSTRERRSASHLHQACYVRSILSLNKTVTKFKMIGGRCP